MQRWQQAASNPVNGSGKNKLRLRSMDESKDKDQIKQEVIISTNNVILTQQTKTIIENIIASIAESNEKTEKTIWVVSIEKTNDNKTKMSFGVCDEIDIICNGYKSKMQIPLNNFNYNYNYNCNHNQHHTIANTQQQLQFERTPQNALKNHPTQLNKHTIDHDQTKKNSSMMKLNNAGADYDHDKTKIIPEIVMKSFIPESNDIPIDVDENNLSVCMILDLLHRHIYDAKHCYFYLYRLNKKITELGAHVAFQEIINHNVGLVDIVGIILNNCHTSNRDSDSKLISRCLNILIRLPRYAVTYFNSDALIIMVIKAINAILGSFVRLFNDKTAQKCVIASLSVLQRLPMGNIMISMNNNYNNNGGNNNVLELVVKQMEASNEFDFSCRMEILAECVKVLTYMAKYMVQQNEFETLTRMINSGVIIELHTIFCRYNYNPDATSTHILLNCVWLLNALINENKNCQNNIITMVNGFIFQDIVNIIQSVYEPSKADQNINRMRKPSVYTVELIEACLKFVEMTLPIMVKNSDEINSNSQIEIKSRKSDPKQVWTNVFAPILWYYHELYRSRKYTSLDAADETNVNVFYKVCNMISNLVKKDAQITYDCLEYGVPVITSIIGSDSNDINDKLKYREKEELYINGLFKVFLTLRKCEWNYIIRYIWIGYYKNSDRKKNKCYIYLLPKDIVKHLIKNLVDPRVSHELKISASTGRGQYHA